MILDLRILKFLPCLTKQITTTKKKNVDVRFLKKKTAGALRVSKDVNSKTTIWYHPELGLSQLSPNAVCCETFSHCNFTKLAKRLKIVESLEILWRLHWWGFHVTSRAARNAKICWIMSQNVFLGCAGIVHRLIIFPRHPNTSWEGIWTPKTYLKHLLRRYLDV